MRDLKRPAVICPTCQGCLVWMFSSGSQLDGYESVEMDGMDPPPDTVPCPRCGAEVCTTGAYAHIPGLPPSFDGVRRIYSGYRAEWERVRQSFEDIAHELISDRGVTALEAELNTPDGLAWFRQRMFYRSSVAFHRCFQLFLGFLVLERHYFKTWASVTGYYSRFYFIQALLNLLLTTWLERDKTAIVFDGTRVVCISHKNLKQMSQRFRSRGSHEIWWALMEALKQPEGYPVDEMGFVLSRLAFNPQIRNTENYSFEYLFGGFNELEWADSGAKQMMSHFMPLRRSDQDFTDVDRFFLDSDPENVDPGAFYGDTDVQTLWCSITAYLRILKALGFDQSFVKTETLVTLSDMHIGDDYPRVCKGLELAVSEILDDGYNPAVVEEVRDLWHWR